MTEEYIENTKKYKQLSAEDRGKIEAYCTIGYSVSKIARLINRSKSTVCEEIKKRKVQR